jgi:spoIIIJ-associated protein
MVEEEKHIEVTGQDVEEAIEIGLAELGLERSEVEIQVVDEGSSGFLGIGGREAIVHLTIKDSNGDIVSQPNDQAGDLAAVEIPPEKPISAEKMEEDVEDTGDGQEEKGVALGIVNNLLDKMKVERTLTTFQTEPDERTGERRWVLDIKGENMGVLIGPRGETLNALQYLSRLMTGHVIRRRPGFIIDIEGYRKRREQALSRLAERMADKALKRGKPISLEPMPANDRRIIHITLRENDQVYTESWGEGNRRKVRIYPKK